MSSLNNTNIAKFDDFEKKNNKQTKLERIIERKRKNVVQRSGNIPKQTQVGYASLTRRKLNCSQ